ncbi:MAG TPA: TonB-dependent receptor [Acidobacteriota bacterium]|nr:TonB-dependent receptor [Acidobacteriota bacterium]HRR25655.1 TonB-dependent receptor [Acidobacteriota bacterium]HRV06843.1 TonB-dependent receptor [Acidobacteriota bacterium]
MCWKIGNPTVESPLSVRPNHEDFTTGNRTASQVPWLSLAALAFSVALCSTVSPAASREDQESLSTPSFLETTTEEPESKSEAEVPVFRVAVTATRSETPVEETGRSVSVVTRSEIEAMGAADVAEVLATLPGIHVSRGASYGSPTSLFVRGGESDSTLVLVDGIPINRPGGEFDLAHLSTVNIERIEVVRGPGSVLYGSEAAAATIHIITRRPKAESRPRGQVSALAGNLGSFEYSGHLEGGSPKIQYSLGAVSSLTDGIFELNSTYRRTDLSAATYIAAGHSTSLSATARYNTIRQGVPTDDIGNPVDPNDWRQTHDSVFQLSLSRAWSEAIRSTVQYGRHQYHGWNYTRADGISDFFDSEFEAAEQRDLLDWENRFTLGGNHLVTAGMTWKREASEDATFDRRSVGLYVQDRRQFGDRVYLTAGVRHEDNNRYEDFTSVQLDLAVRLADNWRLRGGGGNGFRSPSFLEITGMPAFGISGNTHLKPERNTAWELGADWGGEDTTLHASWTFFVNRYRNLIEFTFLAAPGSPNYLNVEAAESNGTEMSVTYRLTSNVRMTGDYTWTQTEVTDAGSVPGGNFEIGQPLLRRPKHQGGLALQLIFPRTSARVAWRYIGSRDDREFLPDLSSVRVRLGGYALINTNVEFTLRTFGHDERRLGLTCRGENLLDRRYTAVAGFASPGRRVQAGLVLGF